MDRRSFEAPEGLTSQQAVSSIDYRRIDPALSLKQKKELDMRGLIRVFDKDSLV